MDNQKLSQGHDIADCVQAKVKDKRKLPRGDEEAFWERKEKRLPVLKKVEPP